MTNFHLPSRIAKLPLQSFGAMTKLHKTELDLASGVIALLVTSLGALTFLATVVAFTGARDSSSNPDYDCYAKTHCNK